MCCASNAPRFYGSRENARPPFLPPFRPLFRSLPAVQVTLARFTHNITLRVQFAEKRVRLTRRLVSGLFTHKTK